MRLFEYVSMSIVTADSQVTESAHSLSLIQNGFCETVDVRSITSDID